MTMKSLVLVRERQVSMARELMRCGSSLAEAAEFLGVMKSDLDHALWNSFGSTKKSEKAA